MAGHPTSHWLVIFCEVPKRHWLHDLLRMPKGYTHCAAVGFGPGGQNWVFFDWRGDTLDLVGYDDDAVNRIWDYVEAHCGTIVGYWPQQPKGKWVWRFRLPFFTCVEALCHLLRIRAPVVTPWGLYRWLLDNGGFALMVRGQVVPMESGDGLRQRYDEYEGGRSGGEAGVRAGSGEEGDRGSPGSGGSGAPRRPPRGTLAHLARLWRLGRRHHPEI